MSELLPKLMDLEGTLSGLEESPRVCEEREIRGRKYTIREARPDDAPVIQALFAKVYQGKYPLDFGSDCRILESEISDPQQFLWVVAAPSDTQELVGA